jgi:hypothetical protein
VAAQCDFQSNLVTTVADNPKVLWDATVDPIRNDWNSGNKAGAVGRVNFMLVEAALGTKGIGRAASTGAAASRTTTAGLSSAAQAVPNPKPVYKPNGDADRSSPWYVSYRDADGNMQTVGNLGGVHAEVRIQQMQPGAPMSRPFGWRTLDAEKGPQWVEGTVCQGCQIFPRSLFPPGTRGAPGGPWGN